MKKALEKNMNFHFPPLRETYKQWWDMQEAFQPGAIEAFGEMEDEIPPESHTDRSLSVEGSVACKALADGMQVGGAVND